MVPAHFATTVPERRRLPMHRRPCWAAGGAALAAGAAGVAWQGSPVCSTWPALSSPSLAELPDTAWGAEPPLVGRQREMAVLARLTGRRVWVLAGPAGVGKSRLLRQLQSPPPPQQQQEENERGLDTRPALRCDLRVAMAELSGGGLSWPDSVLLQMGLPSFGPPPSARLERLAVAQLAVGLPEAAGLVTEASSLAELGRLLVQRRASAEHGSRLPPLLLIDHFPLAGFGGGAEDGASDARGSLARVLLVWAAGLAGSGAVTAVVVPDTRGGPPSAAGGGLGPGWPGWAGGDPSQLDGPLWLADLPPPEANELAQSLIETSLHRHRLESPGISSTDAGMEVVGREEDGEELDEVFEEVVRPLASGRPAVLIDMLSSGDARAASKTARADDLAAAEADLLSWLGLPTTPAELLPSPEEGGTGPSTGWRVGGLWHLMVKLAGCAADDDVTIGGSPLQQLQRLQGGPVRLSSLIPSSTWLALSPAPRPLSPPPTQPQTPCRWQARCLPVPAVLALLSAGLSAAAASRAAAGQTPPLTELAEALEWLEELGSPQKEEELLAAEGQHGQHACRVGRPALLEPLVAAAGSCGGQTLPTGWKTAAEVVATADDDAEWAAEAGADGSSDRLLGPTHLCLSGRLAAAVRRLTECAESHEQGVQQEQEQDAPRAAMAVLMALQHRQWLCVDQGNAAADRITLSAARAEQLAVDAGARAELAAGLRQQAAVGGETDAFMDAIVDLDNAAIRVRSAPPRPSPWAPILCESGNAALLVPIAVPCSTQSLHC